MNIERRRITVSGLPVEIVRKGIKNLHLGVYPPHGRVRVAAPLRVSDNAVRLAVISKLAWIKRQQNRFESQERQSVREYVSRESHYYFGRRYLLNVVEQDGPSRVTVRNTTALDLHVPRSTDKSKTQRVLIDWYRKTLKAAVPPLLEKWQNIIGVNVADWGVKKMKTKWGSCNVKDRRIWVNLELAKKPARCLEYIVVHEMVHLLEPHHNDQFIALMDKSLPQWRLLRQELNSAPLAHENWGY